MGEGFSAYGADALRFTLATYSPQAKRIPLSPKKLEGNRNFCNKIWNATRYALGYLEGATVGRAAPKATLLPNRWILSRLAAATAQARAGIDEFRLDEASLALYHFFWGELCDWYLEISKPIFAAGGEPSTETRDVLAYVLEAALRLLHPFVPFITEELWHKVPRPEGSPLSLALAPYPDDRTAPHDEGAERDMGVLQKVIGAARSVRSEHDVPKAAEVPLLLRAGEAAARLLTAEAQTLRVLVKTAGDPVIEPHGAARPRGAVMHVAADVEVLVQLKGLVEGGKESARVERELKKVEKDLAALKKKLSLPSFAEKAPPEVVAEAHAQVAELTRKQAGLEEARHIAAELGEG
jgi:valyl-tRNA synthetase